MGRATGKSMAFKAGDKIRAGNPINGSANSAPIRIAGLRFPHLLEVWSLMMPHKMLTSRESSVPKNPTRPTTNPRLSVTANSTSVGSKTVLYATQTRFAPSIRVLKPMRNPTDLLATVLAGVVMLF